MADHEKKALDLNDLEVTELEDEDLEGVAGGDTGVQNQSCPTTINNSCGKEPVGTVGTFGVNGAT